MFSEEKAQAILGVLSKIDSQDLASFLACLPKSQQEKNLGVIGEILGKSYSVLLRQMLVTIPIPQKDQIETKILDSLSGDTSFFKIFGQIPASPSETTDWLSKEESEDLLEGVDFGKHQKETEEKLD